MSKKCYIFYMFKLEIKKYGNPVLRTKCEEVKEINEEVRSLAKDMLKIMYREDGVGLAAPQIGDKRRIIVVDIGQGPLSLINPQILIKSKKTFRDYEGCLSLPGINLKIKRAKKVEIQGFLLEKNQLVKIQAEGLLARDFQHEIDHLNGVLIIDHTSPFKKLRAIRKLKKKLRV